MAHVRRIGGERQIELNADVWQETLGSRKGAPEVELLQDRKHKVDSWQIAQVLKCTRQLEHDGTRGAIINRGTGQSRACKLNDIWCIDDRRADIHPSLNGLIGTLEATVDVELLIGNDAVFLFRASGMVALVGDDSCTGLAARKTEHDLLRGERALRHATHAFGPDQAGGFDLAYDKSQLIHMRDQHHGWKARIALDGGNQIAEHIGFCVYS
jgi:hypothetical protein